jgi:FtsZ-interacting cell division protein ZipA
MYLLQSQAHPLPQAQPRRSSLSLLTRAGWNRSSSQAGLLGTTESANGSQQWHTRRSRQQPQWPQQEPQGQWQQQQQQQQQQWDQQQQQQQQQKQQQKQKTPLSPAVKAMFGSVKQQSLSQLQHLLENHAHHMDGPGKQQQQQPRVHSKRFCANASRAVGDSERQQQQQQQLQATVITCRVRSAFVALCLCHCAHFFTLVLPLSQLSIARTVAC